MNPLHLLNTLSSMNVVEIENGSTAGKVAVINIAKGVGRSISCQWYFDIC